MIFNSIDFKDFVTVEEVRKSLLPPISNTLKDIPGKNGSRFIRNKLEANTIEVDIRLIERLKYNWEDKTRILASYLYTSEPKKIYIKGTGKYNYVILEGNTDFERMLYTGFTTLSFICSDPVDYGTTKAFDITNNPAIYNTGTYPTKGIITVDITANVDHLQITLLNTGEFIYLGHNFIAGDTVTIDLEEELAYKNGYSVMKDCYLESDFFEIPVGEFKILVSSGNATLEYIERWL